MGHEQSGLSALRRRYAVELALLGAPETPRISAAYPYARVITSKPLPYDSGGKRFHLTVGRQLEQAFCTCTFA